MSAERRVLVAIHDVAPPFTEECLALVRLCREYGVEPALLVVPEWHGRWPLDDAPALVRWLRAAQDGGTELLLHGMRHDEVGTVRSLTAHWRAVGRTAREGEFLSLSFAHARARIDEGKQRLEAMGLAPIGFVPPAWLASPAVLRAAAAAGFPLSEDDAGVRALVSGRLVRAPAVRWSARTRARAVASRAVAHLRRVVHADAPMVRLALHPRDLHDAGVAASLRDAVRWWTRTREPITYRQAIAESR
ncbi:MAG: DUF2334 domain-containing protein [Gemmatimonadaceae bacterium]|nr:DUF2334 domain-containing protein [Gemmatimonadaceae bacterium]